MCVVEVEGSKSKHGADEDEFLLVQRPAQGLLAGLAAAPSQPCSPASMPTSCCQQSSMTHTVCQHMHSAFVEWIGNASATEQKNNGTERQAHSG